MRQKFLFLICLILAFLLTSCDGQSSSVNPTATAVTASCPEIVEKALSAVDVICADAERNQVCYGNFNLQSQPQADVVNFTLAEPGDIANLTDVQSLQLSPMNVASEEWGIALMRLQASLPDTLPGQNVTFLLFGDVQFENRDAQAQSYYFQTGVGDAPCAEAPDSGILVQTPTDVRNVSITLNEVQIDLSSTAYLQAQPEAEMTVSLVEGSANVTAQGVTQKVVAGNRTAIQLDADGNASSEPSLPVTYTSEAVAPLPVRVLEREISIQAVNRMTTFVESVDGWTTHNDATNFEHFPADELADGYVCADDLSSGINWYFEAPPEWIEDVQVAYGGVLNYVILQRNNTSQYDAPDIILASDEMMLHYRVESYPETDWTTYSIPLHENAVWFVGTSETSTTELAPTQAEFQAVLSNLTTLWIRGEYRAGSDSACLDQVQLVS